MFDGTVLFLKGSTRKAQSETLHLKFEQCGNTSFGRTAHCRCTTVPTGDTGTGPCDAPRPRPRARTADRQVATGSQDGPVCQRRSVPAELSKCFEASVKREK